MNVNIKDNNRKMYRPKMNTGTEAEIAELRKIIEALQKKIEGGNDDKYTCELCHKGIVEYGDVACSKCGASVSWGEENDGTYQSTI